MILQKVWMLKNSEWPRRQVEAKLASTMPLKAFRQRFEFLGPLARPFLIIFGFAMHIYRFRSLKLFKYLMERLRN